MTKAKTDAPASMRDMTEQEQKEMLAGGPPEGYANAPTTTAEPPAEAPPAPPAAAAPAKPPVTPPAAPPAGDPPAPAPESPSVDMEKLERELAKPEDQADLKDFTKREKAYYSQMRRDRKARQAAEAELDVTRRKLHQAQNPPPPPPDPFDGMGEDDVLTVKEMRERMKKQPPAAPPAAEQAPQVSPQHVRYLTLCENEARAAHPDDFDAVMELSDELVATDPAALREISEKTKAGENPAELMYQVIKRHKDFETLLPAAQIRANARLNKGAAPASPASAPAPAVPETPPVPPADPAKVQTAQSAQQALEKNGNKPKTTAHVSSREGKPVAELTADDISRMSDLEFARLPRHVRDKYLREYGSEPAPKPN